MESVLSRYLLFTIGKSRCNIVKLQCTACYLLDRCFGGAVAAGESKSVRGVGSFPCPIASSMVRDEGCQSGRALVMIGYNRECAANATSL